MFNRGGFCNYLQNQGSRLRNYDNFNSQLRLRWFV